jgi:hypothetical protein
VPIIPSFDARAADLPQQIIERAGQAGKSLAAVVGAEKAARLIYEASTKQVAPDFYVGDMSPANRVEV